MVEVKTLVKGYMEEAKLMQLATSANGQPWVCSVWFAADEDLNIYYFSSTLRRHSREVAANRKVSGAIALPHTPLDKPKGVQFQGDAEMLTEKADIDDAISLYAGRIFPKEKVLELMERSSHAFYRIRPTMFVLFDVVDFPDSPRQEFRL